MEDHPPTSKEDKGRGRPQAGDIALSEIQHLFRKNEVFDQDISIEHEGKLYRLRCNDRAFTVYRVNPYQGMPPGIPGWPVCMVHGNAVFQECGFPALASDHLTCELGLNDWLDMVRQYCCRNLDV